MRHSKLLLALLPVFPLLALLSACPVNPEGCRSDGDCPEETVCRDLVCIDETDDVVDAGEAPDAGDEDPDAGFDAGAADAGANDAGGSDAGADAGAADAGAGLDSGPDAGDGG